MKPIVVAIHGILTGQTNPSWPDQFDAWMFRRDPGVKVLKKEYLAGPFPRWNCFVQDPRLARALVNELALLLGPPAADEHQTISRPIWFFAHSNGAVIALQTIERLIQRGYRVGGVILSGAACEADVEQNGILRACTSGQLGAAIAWSSVDDHVLPAMAYARRGTGASWCSRAWSRIWARLVWPYGSLGRTGWLLNGQPYSPSLTDPHLLRIETRWVRGGHSACFAPDRIESTFDRAYQDIANL